MLGIDGLWCEIVPPVTRVELPRPGTILRRGEPVAVLHAGGRSVPIEAPLNGMVVRTNPRVAADPALLARDPYGEGWLFSATPADESYKKLPAGSAAASWLLAEADRLERFLALERSKGGGGEFLASAAAALDEEGFRRLARAFLHA
jgi:glycine cleavage system H lipoate-binding protein